MKPPCVRRPGRRDVLPAQRPLALALALACATATAPWSPLALAQTVPPVPARTALPTGPAVVHGTANIVRQGAQMTVTNSAQAVLNWQSFSIGAGASVRFDQPNASSQVLNRVLGNDPSAIFGQLSSNGRVWLLNPHGVLFGPTARVDVAGLVASTLNLTHQDWLGRRDVLRSVGAAAGPEAAVVNQGELRASSGGRIVLAGAGQVRNEGLIEAVDGQVMLAAGRSIDLVDTHTPNLALRVQAPAGEALNLGRIDAGRIELAAALVNQQGLLRATSLSGEGGQIELRASSAINLATGSQTLSSGVTSGGRVVADAGRQGTLLVEGEVRADASGTGATGGRIEALGKRVGLLDGSSVSVSAPAGGGRIFVGGGLQGWDASVPNAESVFVAPWARLAADATGLGDGGRIILWSDKATRAYGRFSARGGPDGGNGGFVETSGGWLDARPAAMHTLAPKGRAGEWLIDPHDLTISDTGPDADISAGPSFTTTADSAVITTGTIASALLAGNNVTLTTAAAGGTQPGDIFMGAATLSVGLSVPVTLTLNARRDILFNGATITSTNAAAPLSLTLNPAGGGGGVIEVFNSNITSPGGTISLLGGVGDSTVLIGTRITNGSTVSAVGGTITMTGTGYGGSDAEGLVAGVSIGSGSLVTARDITLTGSTTSDAAGGDRYGVRINNATVTATRNLVATGTVTSTTAWDWGSFANSVYGVNVDASAVSVTPGTGPAGLLQLVGTANEGPRAGTGSFLPRYGLLIDGAATLTASGGSTIDLQGNAPATSPAWGLGILTPAVINAVTSGGFSAQSTQDMRITSTAITLPTAAPALIAPAGFLTFDGALTGLPTSLSMTTGSTMFLGGTLNVGSSPVVIAAGGALDMGSGTDLSLTAGQVAATAGGALRVLGASSIAASGTGSAIVLDAQQGGSFASAGALSAPNGRWLVYGGSPGDLDTTNLAYDFKQYGAASGATALGAGNGVLYAAPGRLTLSSGVLTKTYDGLATITAGTGPIITGLLGDETLTGEFHFADANVGAGKQLNPGNGTTTTGVNDGVRPVYGYAGDSSLVGSVTPRTLSLTGVTVFNKEYNGTTAATAVPGTGTVSGAVPGETFILIVSGGDFSTPAVGTAKPVSVPYVLANGTGLTTNYTYSGVVAATADITPRQLLIQDVIAANKVYDGSPATSLSGGNLIRLGGGVATLPGEDLGFTLGGGTFSDANVGTGKSVLGTATLVNGLVGLASNYELSFGATVGATADITPRTLTLSGVTAGNKVYDGTTATTLSGGTLAGLVAGEALTLTLGTGGFNTAAVGAAKPVTGTALLANGVGGLASNYQLSAPGLATTANITPRPITLTGVSSVNKAYDGTTTATLAGGALNGLVAGEDLVLSLTGAAFSSPDAGLGKAVLGSFGIANGTVGVASNYAFSGSVLATADITPRPVTITGVVVADKVYDGLAATTVTGGTLSGVVAGQDLLFALGPATFNNANAGLAKPVTGTAGLISGQTSLAANYQLTGGFSSTGNILQRPVTLTATVAAPKVYDGTTVAALSGTGLTGLVTGEDLNVVVAGGFATPGVGVAKPVTGSATLANGTLGLAANYVLGAGTISTTANITPRPLTLTGVTALDKTYDGSPAAALRGGTLAGLVATEDLTLSLGSASFNNANAGVGKPVTGTVSLGDGARGLASNYLLGNGTVATSATINPATLTALADLATGFVGAPLPAFTGSVSGFVAGETLATATTGTLRFTVDASPTSPAGAYALAAGGLSAANYRLVDAPRNASAFVLQVLPPATPKDVERRIAEPPPAMFPPPAPSSPGVGRALDAVPVVTPVTTPSTGGSVGQTAFAPIDRGNLTQGEIAGVLAARSSLKKSTFAPAIERLAVTPTLADAPACTSIEQAETGTCLITERVRDLARARAGRSNLAFVASVASVAPAAPAPASPVAVAPAPAPAAPVATAPAPAAAAPAARVATPALASPLPGILDPVLPRQRRVRTAVLPEIQRKVAILIGIDNYSDNRIPGLNNAGNDARAVAQTLESSLGYETLVLKDPTRAEIIRTLNRLALQLEPQDSLVIYYAGHGELIEATGQGYWQPSDADATRPETWLSNNDIGRLMSLFAARQVALLSDSCFSGSLLGDERIRGINPAGDPKQLLQRRAAVVMTSGGNEPVFDAGRNGHSPFAWNLMRTIENVPTWRPGSNVFESVRFAVARELPQRPQYGSSRLGGHESGSDYVFEQRQLEGRN